MANEIKKINVGTITYDVVDEYARRRLEGLTNVYSISCEHAGSSSNTYVDYITGETITYSTMAIANSEFKPTELPVQDSITITKTTGKTTYIVLTSKTTAGAYYAVRFLDMNLGDTVYVTERTTVIGTETVAIPDRWLSGAVEDTSATFTILDGKIDLKEYAKRTESGKAGTYTTSAASTETSGSAGAQTASGSGTYKKSDTATGSAGAATLTTSSNTSSSQADTGEAGGHTIDISDCAFAGVEGQISVSASYKPAGTISAVTASAHSHTVNVAKSTVTVVTGFTEETSIAGAHTHNVSGSCDITLNTADIQVGTGTVNYTPEGTISAVTANAHSHTVNVAKSTVTNNVTGTATGSAGSHSHTVDSHTHAASVTAVTGVTAASLTGTTSFNTDAIKAIAGTKNYGFASAVSNATDTAGFYQGVMTHPVVENNILKWTCVEASTQDAHTGTAATKASVGITGGTASGTASVAGVESAATLTSSSAASHTHSLTNSKLEYVSSATTGTAGSINVTPTFTGTGKQLYVDYGVKSASISATAASAGAHAHSVEDVEVATVTYVTGATTSTAGAINVTPTFTGTTATISSTGTFTPQGSLSGSITIAAHSHTYYRATGHTHTVTISGHTHSIGLSDATVNVSVAVSNHTHSIGHTHTVTVPNCVS